MPGWIVQGATPQLAGRHVETGRKISLYKNNRGSIPAVIEIYCSDELIKSVGIFKNDFVIPVNRLSITNKFARPATAAVSGFISSDLTILNGQSPMRARGDAQITVIAEIMVDFDVDHSLLVLL